MGKATLPSVFNKVSPRPPPPSFHQTFPKVFTYSSKPNLITRYTEHLFLFPLLTLNRNEISTEAKMSYDEDSERRQCESFAKIACVSVAGLQPRFMSGSLGDYFHGMKIDTIEKQNWSSSAPPWRVATQGLNLEGKWPPKGKKSNLPNTIYIFQEPAQILVARPTTGLALSPNGVAATSVSFRTNMNASVLFASNMSSR